MQAQTNHVFGCGLTPQIQTSCCVSVQPYCEYALNLWLCWEMLCFHQLIIRSGYSLLTNHFSLHM